MMQWSRLRARTRVLKDREPKNVWRFAGAKSKGFGLYERNSLNPERSYLSSWMLSLSKTADAFRYFEQAHAKGKVVITVGT